MLSDNSIINKAYLKLCFRKALVISIIFAGLLILSLSLLYLPVGVFFQGVATDKTLVYCDRYVFMSFILIALWSLFYWQKTNGALFKRVSTDFIGSLPIKRSALHLSSALAGEAFIAIFSLISALSMLFSGFSGGIFSCLEMLRCFILVFAGSSLFFSLVGIASAASGNILAYIVLALTIAVFVPSLYAFINCNFFCGAFSAYYQTPYVQPLMLYAMSAYPFIPGEVAVIALLNVALSVLNFVFGALVMKRKNFADSGKPFSKPIITDIVVFLTFSIFMMMFISIRRVSSAVLVTIIVIYIVSLFLYGKRGWVKYIRAFAAFLAAAGVAVALAVIAVIPHLDAQSQYSDPIIDMNYDEVESITLNIPYTDMTEEYYPQVIDFTPYLQNYMMRYNRSIKENLYTLPYSIAWYFSGRNSSQNTERTDIFSYFLHKDIFHFGSNADSRTITVTDPEVIKLFREFLLNNDDYNDILSKDYERLFPQWTYYSINKTAVVSLKDGKKYNVTYIFNRFNIYYKDKFGRSILEEYDDTEKSVVRTPLCYRLNLSYDGNISSGDIRVVPEINDILKGEIARQNSTLDAKEREDLKYSDRYVDNDGAGTYVRTVFYYNGRYRTQTVKIDNNSELFDILMEVEFNEYEKMKNKSPMTYTFFEMSKYDTDFNNFIPEDIAEIISHKIKEYSKNGSDVLTASNGTKKAVFFIDDEKKLMTEIVDLYCGKLPSLIEKEISDHFNTYLSVTRYGRDEVLCSLSKKYDYQFNDAVKFFEKYLDLTRQYYLIYPDIASGKSNTPREISSSVVMKLNGIASNKEILLFAPKADYIDLFQHMIYNSVFEHPDNISSIIVGAGSYIFQTTLPEEISAFSDWFLNNPCTDTKDQYLTFSVTVNRDDGTGPGRTYKVELICYGPLHDLFPSSSKGLNY